MSGSDMLQILMAGLGSVGFALIFGLKGSKLVTIGIGGALAWTCFLVGDGRGAPRMGLFWGVIVAAAISEIEARRRKTPVLVMEVPTLISLVPGGDLYRMVDSVMRKGLEESGDAAMWLLQEVFIIAAGIILVSTIASGYTKFLYRFGKNKA